MKPKRVERFSREAVVEPAQSTSRNPLEQPWSLAPEEFTRRAPRPDLQKFTPARDETAALTTQIQNIEQEIDQRIATHSTAYEQPWNSPLHPHCERQII